jgi:hypothetical protein
MDLEKFTQPPGKGLLYHNYFIAKNQQWQRSQASNGACGIAVICEEILQTLIKGNPKAI